MIVECNVWCNGASNQEIYLGLDPGDSWMPFAVDFNEISAIKLSGPTDFLGDDKATIHFNGQHVTIDMTYTEAVKKWREAKGETWS